VSRHDVDRFLARLEEIAGSGFRLPTEAEWERACRAGGSAPFATGASLTSAEANIDDDLAREGAHVGSRTTRVGSFAPNAFGLYDMHGNVWEWTADRHCPYPAGRARDPRGSCASGLEVIRGGSWHYDAASARCALRYTHRPQDSGFSLGFRLARSLDGD
jgi:formylglycine-generating enzyme required for sulfatase activity